jgi:uncharacterized membrane protein
MTPTHDRPRTIMRWIMAVFFIAGFGAHLYAAPSFGKIVPDWMPFPHETVLITGVLELLGGVGLLIPRLRWWAGLMLAIYAIAVWPANMKHAFEHVALTYIPDSWWYHGPRLALQPVIAWWALFCAGVTDWPFSRRASDIGYAKE